MTYDEGSCVGCYFVGLCSRIKALCPKRIKEIADAVPDYKERWIQCSLKFQTNSPECEDPDRSCSDCWVYKQHKKRYPEQG